MNIRDVTQGKKGGAFSREGGGRTHTHKGKKGGAFNGEGGGTHTHTRAKRAVPLAAKVVDAHKGEGGKHGLFSSTMALITSLFKRCLGKTVPDLSQQRPR